MGRAAGCELRAILSLDGHAIVAGEDVAFLARASRLRGLELGVLLTQTLDGLAHLGLTDDRFLAHETQVVDVDLVNLRDEPQSWR